MERPPPDEKQLRRWCVSLSQPRLATFHIAGIKNELCDYLFFLNVDQFETKFWAGAPPHAKYYGRGITYKKGGKFAGHGSCMAEACALSPVPSLFAFWVMPRKVWVEAFIWCAVKVVWGRVVLVVVVLCAAGMTVVWRAVTRSWVVTSFSPSVVWVAVVCTPVVRAVFCALEGKMCCRWSLVW